MNLNKRGQMRIKGPWNEPAVAAFLEQARMPVRIGVVTESGAPVVVSLWYQYRDGALWCVCHRDARLISWLAANPHCGFEVAGDAPPYRGVRGQGMAQLQEDGGEALLQSLLERYGIPQTSRLGRKLLARAAEEVAIRIAPGWITSWDFSERMADAVRQGGSEEKLEAGVGIEPA
jgi:nitroimidazol reductase NimA-like FMN-containing flavoprotein (pyridoxamine 5'-phosphate oxidase superfamily)